jgi:hypothetical protein
MQAEVLISDAGKTSGCLTVQYKKTWNENDSYFSPWDFFHASENKL